MRAKITIFQTSVFQLFISLLYRRTYFCFHTELTELHRIGSTYLHVSTRKKFSREGAKDAEQYVLLFLCQKSLHTESTEIHRILLRMLFCESLRRLRETIPLRTAFCEFRGFHVNPSIISNSCAFMAQKNTSRYEQIRGDFSVYSVDSV